MKHIPFLLLLGAMTIMACKSSEDASNSAGAQDNIDNVESIGLEKTTDSQQLTSSGTSGKVEQEGMSKAKHAAVDLVGQWVWVKTNCCGRMMGETIPGEEEVARIISFDGKGTASYFTDNSKEKVYDMPYKVGILGPLQPTVRIGELQPAIFVVKDDTLVLSWGYMDLHIEYYERIK